MTELKKINILIVEDNPGDARLIQEMLKEANDLDFIFTCADRLENAFENIEEKSHDVIFLDLSLPDSFGLATFERLQQKAPNTPVIVMTGNDDEATAVNAVRSGAQDYLVKGRSDKRLLLRSLLYALERHRLKAELKKANETILEQHKQLIEEERLKVMLQMAGAMAHELNNPLMILLGNIDLLKSHKDSSLNIQDFLFEIETSGRRIANIVKRIQNIQSIKTKPYPGGAEIIDID